MTNENSAKTVGAGALLLVVLLLGGLINSPSAHAQSNADADRIQQGFAMAPVPLNLMGKSSYQVALVGRGSYLVNAIGDCNGCHTSGGPPNFNYLYGHNPYFLHPGPAQANPAEYLAGGANFSTALPFNVGPGLPYGNYLGPNIIARNLTPDLHGLPEGGKTLAQFRGVLRTGVDMDHIHPTCTSSTPVPTPPNCIPPPVDGSRLQIMPWPVFHQLSDDDIEAVYEYLSAIPCIDNKTSTPPDGAPNELRNNCGSSDNSGAVMPTEDSLARTRR